jgi:hypothetical protein
MSDGYTFTSITARPGESARIGVSFYLDHDAWIAVASTETGRPHLYIAHGEVSVSVSPRTEAITADDAVIARRLADHAAEYATEVERLSGQHQQADSAGPTAA